MTVTHTREFIVLGYLPLGVFKNVIKIKKKKIGMHIKKQIEIPSCLFPIQLKWGGWTDDEVSFILKFCDSFCVTARWSQDCFKLFWVEVLCYKKFLPWNDCSKSILHSWSGFLGQFTWKCVCISWALLRGLACFTVIYRLFI